MSMKVTLQKNICLICSVLLVLSTFSGCKEEIPAPSSVKTEQHISEHYEYSDKGGLYLWPSMVFSWVEKDGLKAITEDGTFYCYTDDTDQADDFVYAQCTLLRFLQGLGVATVKMDYYATHYDDSFSESSEKAAYIALSAVKSWYQILVTLQTLWGDYIEYGYLYALSNAIAAELGWQTDDIPTVDQAKMDAFFIGNPDAIQLLYPSFSTEYATEETVNCCKALSVQLFENIDWKTALYKSVSTQLFDFYALVSGYAQQLGIPFIRQTCGYAYYGERIPLRISTKFAKLYLDDGYVDLFTEYYDGYFSDYSSIYQTVNLIDREITETVEYFGLGQDAEVIRINFIRPESKANSKFKGEYIAATNTVNVTSLDLYLYEYCAYLQCLMNPDIRGTWQASAFCFLASSRSEYYFYGMTQSMQSEKEWSEQFDLFTDSSNLIGKDYFREANDLLCYIDGFGLGSSCANTTSSMSHYLADQHGMETALNLLLYPNTVEKMTGKTWNTLVDEWERWVRQKYDGKDLPF